LSTSQSSTQAWLSSAVAQFQILIQADASLMADAAQLQQLMSWSSGLGQAGLGFGGSYASLLG